MSQEKDTSWSTIFLEEEVVEGDSGGKRMMNLPKSNGWLSIDPTYHLQWFE